MVKMEVCGTALVPLTVVTGLNHLSDLIECSRGEVTPRCRSNGCHVRRGGGTKRYKAVKLSL